MLIKQLFQNDPIMIAWFSTCVLLFFACCLFEKAIFTSHAWYKYIEKSKLFQDPKWIFIQVLDQVNVILDLYMCFLIDIMCTCVFYTLIITHVYFLPKCTLCTCMQLKMTCFNFISHISSSLHEYFFFV